jgi:hypothetical protein
MAKDDVGFLGGRHRVAEPLPRVAIGGDVRRAAFERRKDVTAAPRTSPSLGRPKTRIERDYPALARQILAHPDWTGAAARPENRRGRVLARLMDAALASRLSNSSAQLEAVQ